jgi:hypothetical protein
MRIRSNQPAVKSEVGYPTVIWVALVAIFSPPIMLDLGLIWTPGRAATILLLGPAFLVILRRQFLFCDFLACLTAVWSLGAVSMNGGFRPYALVEILEFLGGYMIGRAFLFGPLSLQRFVQAFKAVVITIVFMGLLDVASGRRFTAEIFSSIFPVNVDLDEVQFRFNLVRATATFPTAELYGTFCAVATGIFLFSERTVVRKISFAGIAAVGCLLSVSSGPVLALAISFGVYGYDRLFWRYPDRWGWFVRILCVSIVSLFFWDVVIRQNELLHPFLIVVRNLTFVPETGYFRATQWEHAVPIIMLSPWIGNGWDFSVQAGDNMLLSIDNFYLVMMWRFGIPAPVLILLTAVSVSRSGSRNLLGADSFMGDMRTAFSLAVWTFATVGITVHFWDATWIFWSLCIGVRASIKQYYSGINDVRRAPSSIDMSIKRRAEASGLRIS